MKYNPHQLAIMAAAERLGVEVVDLQSSTGLDLIRLRHAERSVLVLKGRIFAGNSVIGDRVCEHKEATKVLMRELGIPVPGGLRFDHPDQARGDIERFLDEVGVAVVKPDRGTHGHAVVMHVTEYHQVTTHIDEHGAKHAPWLIEEQVSGHDLRMHCIDGRVVAACVRKPAHVVGDGVRNLAALIEARQEVMRVQNPNNRLEVDDITKTLLSEQGYTLESVPPVGSEVQLKHVANMSVGGVAVDVTDALHERWHEYACQLTAMLDLRVFAFDAIVRDVAEDPAIPGTGARVLEVNARGEWLHHTFSEPRSHDIPGMLVRLLFPELPGC